MKEELERLNEEVATLRILVRVECGCNVTLPLVLLYL